MREIKFTGLKPNTRYVALWDVDEFGQLAQRPKLIEWPENDERFKNVEDFLKISAERFDGVEARVEVLEHRSEK